MNLQKNTSGLSNFELELIASFLEDAEENYRDRSCNDYFVPATEENRLMLLAAFHHIKDELGEDNADMLANVPVVDGELFVWDSTLMRYLSFRSCNALADKAQHLSQAELVAIADLFDYIDSDDMNGFEQEDGCEDFTLDASADCKAYLRAVVANRKRDGWQEKMQTISNTADVITMHAIDLLEWLALRCRGRVALPTAGDSTEAAKANEKRGNEDNLSRLGVSKKWLSEKSIVKRITDQDESWVPAFAQNQLDLVTYLKGGNPFKDFFKPELPLSPPFARPVAQNLLWKAANQHNRAATVALFGPQGSDDAATELAQQAAYEFWNWKVLVHQAKAVGQRDYRIIAKSLIECLYHGHIQQAGGALKVLHAAWGLQAQSTLPVPKLYDWLVRIAFKRWNMPVNLTKYHSPGEPVLEELIAHWDQPDLASMQSQLIWLCDFYTHEFGQGVVGWDWAHARLPFTLLAWFRLRESVGLTNPVIDHPLMKPVYANLPTARTMFVDETIVGVIGRLEREELPQLAQINEIA